MSSPEQIGKTGKERKEEGEIYLTIFTLERLRVVLEERKRKVRDLGEVKRDAYSSDGFHSEIFQRVEEEMVLLGRVLTLYPMFADESWEKRVKIIAPNQSDRVGLGSKVNIRWKGEFDEVIIVAPLDIVVNPSNDFRWISAESPVGSALMGRKAGEEVKVETPEGVVSLIIESVLPALELSRTTD